MRGEIGERHSQGRLGHCPLVARIESGDCRPAIQRRLTLVAGCEKNTLQTARSVDVTVAPDSLLSRELFWHRAHRFLGQRMAVTVTRAPSHFW
jgi:hypothetical protein